MNKLIISWFSLDLYKQTPQIIESELNNNNQPIQIRIG